MVKIFLLVGNYLPGFKSGGALRSTVNMVNRLGKEYEFKILTSDRDIGDNTSYSNINPNDWNKSGNASVYYLSSNQQSIKNIAKIISDTDHDILYLNSFFNPYFTIYPLLARKMGLIPNKPVIIATRGEFADGALNIKRFKKNVYMFFAKIFRLHENIYWQASSEFEKNDIHIALRKKNLDIIIAPNIPKYLQSKSENKTVFQKNENILRICFLGRIAPVKNLDYALRVLSKVGINVRFDIYGPKEDKNYWNHCEELIKNIPENIIIKYNGALENDAVHDMLKMHDLLFLPTKGENFGHVILESMSAGTPVLIANTTPWRNLQEHGAGWDISLETPHKFVSAIEYAYLINKNEYIHFRNSTRNYAVKFANDDSILESSRRLFMNALERENV
jgi:glycosyltransferase involved in cell wall biosynthesis